MTSVSESVTRGSWTPAEDAELLRMFNDPATPSWSTRAVALGHKFHGGVRRGGAETCSRYFLLKKSFSSDKRHAKKETAPNAKKIVKHK
jgi:hypothetical protein